MVNPFAPITEQINRQGNILQYGQQLRRQRDLDERQKEKDVLAAEATRAQIASSRASTARTEQLTKFDNEDQAMEYMIKAGPMITWQGYPKAREDFLKRGINEALLPDTKTFVKMAAENEMPVDAFFKTWKDWSVGQMTEYQRKKLTIEKAVADAQIAKAKSGGKVKTVKMFHRDKGVKDIKVLPENVPAMEEAGYTVGAPMTDEKDESRMAEKDLRTYVQKLYGISDLSSYDPEITDKIRRTVTLAENLMEADPELSVSKAVDAAYQDVAGEYAVLEKLPRKSKGTWQGDTKEKTIPIVTQSLQGGAATSIIFQKLLNQGWSEEEAKAIILEAGK